MKRFAFGILAGVLLVYGGLAGAYGALASIWPGSLPAPAISRLVPLDEKLRFLRRNEHLDPHMLAVGSSITWRQVAGSEFARITGDAGHFLNGATGFLKIHQTRDLLDFYLKHYPNVRTVLLFTGLPDFEDCTTEPAAMLDHEDAAAYAFEQAPDLYFYLRYFSPQRYLRGAMTLDRRSRPLVGDLSFDRYGSSPLNVPVDMLVGLRYGAIGHDPACATALTDLADDLAGRRIRLVVVFAPIHPEYRRQFPAAVAELGRLAHDLEARSDPGAAQVIRLIDDGAYLADDFFDAFHLQWPAVQRFSGSVATAMAAPGGAAGGQLTALPGQPAAKPPRKM